MQARAAHRGVWIGVLAAGLILGLAGPFGTDTVMRLVPRIGYWTVVAIVGFFGGSAVATFAGRQLRRLALPRWLGTGLAGALAGLVLFALLVGLNTAVFGPGFLDRETVTRLAINVVAISVIVSAAFVAIEHHMAARAPQTATAAAPARILARLPYDKRGRLLALSVADHYVEVVTDKGSSLVLLRLADAMAETGDVPGLQVHRSHWIALEAVASVRRDGARAIATLTDGRDIPVSRTYLAAIKEAGLLPA
ncbi:MAG: LytTR family transcriptional regulator [Maritimibacter sp.]|nr:LytTR family transcriptional regulator [Maritimibacter sp.]